MNKKLYSILFFVPFIACLLAMTVVTGCSDDDEPLQSTYGYVQFRLLRVHPWTKERQRVL